ncbi:MAG: hypothetical protein V4526_02930 [Patescibacteria group bacterium]
MITIKNPAKLADEIRRIARQGAEHPYNAFAAEVEKLEERDYEHPEFIEKFCEMLLVAVGSAPSDQTVQLRLNLSDLVDVLVDLENGDVVEGNVRSRMGWVT